MPSTTTGAGVRSGNGTDTISDDESDPRHRDNSVLEDIQVPGGPDENVVGEERERNLHSKKHRRQLLSPPSAAAGLQGVTASINKNGGNLTSTQNGMSAQEKGFMNLDD